MTTQASSKNESGKCKLPSATVCAPAPALPSLHSARTTPRALHSARTTPRAGQKALPRQIPAKTESKTAKAKTQEKADLLPSAASLLALASTKTAEAAELDEAIQNVHEQSLERQVGAAIAELKKSPAEAIYEWQANKGKLIPIELRQAVRNKLKIRADNKAIDALFASLDTNHSGALDATQLQVAVKKITKANKDAKKDAVRLMEAASNLRAVAEHARLAGEAVALLELHVGEDSHSESETAAPPSLLQRAVLTVLRGGMSVDKLMSLWDKDRKGTMTSKQLVQALRDIRVPVTDAAEVTVLYTELAVAINAETDAPLATKLIVRHIVDLAKVEGMRQKEREGELHRMRKEARHLVRELEEMKLRVDKAEGSVTESPTGDKEVKLAAVAQALGVAAGQGKGICPSGGSATGSEHSSPLDSPLSSPGGTVPCSARKPTQRRPSQEGTAAVLW